MSTSTTAAPPTTPGVPGSPARRRPGILQLLVLSIAALAPATVLAAGPLALVGPVAGNGTWLAYLVGAVIALAVAFCVRVFAQRLAVSGSLYSYVQEGIGPRAAALAGAGLLVGYVGVAWAVVAGVGAYTGSLFGSAPDDLLVQGGTCLVVAVLAWAIAVRGVQEAAWFTLAVQALSILVVTVVVVAAVISDGVQLGDQLALEGASLKGVGLAVAIVFISFVGFESSAALGAEARDPQRAIPRLLVGIPVGLGVLYVLFALLQTPMLPSVLDRVLAGASPVNAVAEDAGLGALAPVLDASLAASFAAAAVGLLTFVSRIVATMAEDGLLPRALGATHTTHGTPHRAVALVAAGAVVVPVVLTATTGQGALGVFALVGTPGAFGFLFAYVLLAVAAVLVRRRTAGRLGSLLVAAPVAIVGAVGVYVVNITDPAAAPFDSSPWVAAVAVVAVAVPMLIAVGRHGAQR
jgi:amino acid transporter